MSKNKEIIQGKLKFVINEDDKTANIISNDNISGEVTIPRTIKYDDQEYDVTSILKDSFANSTQLYSVTLPSSIIRICEGAFSRSKLSKVTIPKNSQLQLIEKYSFSHCANLDKIYIPQQVTEICEGAFSDCYRLHQINFHPKSKLQIIGKNAFSHSSIESICIPSSCSQLMEGWCSFIQNLNRVIIMQNNRFFMNFNKEIILGKTDAKTDEFDNLVFVSRNSEEVEIPSTIKQISSYAFNNSSINQIFIPHQISQIGEGAFMFCLNLQKVEFQKNSLLKKIDKDAFTNTDIEKICIPSNVTLIGEYAFSCCSKLKIVEIQTDSKIEKIENFAFFGSCALKKIFIPTQTKKIGDSAFCNCESLQKVEILPDSQLQSIGNKAFFNSPLKCIFIPNRVTQIGNDAFLCCHNLQIIECGGFSVFQTIVNGNVFLYFGTLITVPSKL